MLYKRVLLKISGEALLGARGLAIDLDIVTKIAKSIIAIKTAGVDVAIVIGGGNIARGVNVANSSSSARVSADHMGMLATAINALALHSALSHLEADAIMFSAISMPSICDLYNQVKVMKALDEGKVVIFVAGTGNPYFTTDTAATLRAIEIGADVLVKATQVDGVYDSDPRLNAEAVRLDKINYDEAISRNLAVMDATSIVLAKEHKLPMIVCSLAEPENLQAILCGEGKFSLVH